jgi:hypothetical protein
MSGSLFAKGVKKNRIPVCGAGPDLNTGFLSRCLRSAAGRSGSLIRLTSPSWTLCCSSGDENPNASSHAFGSRVNACYPVDHSKMSMACLDYPVSVPQARALPPGTQRPGRSVLGASSRASRGRNSFRWSQMLTLLSLHELRMERKIAARKALSWEPANIQCFHPTAT